MQITRTVPVLRIFDEALAREFYLEWNTLELIVGDPFGNRLSFNQRRE